MPAGQKVGSCALPVIKIQVVLTDFSGCLSSSFGLHAFSLRRYSRYPGTTLILAQSKIHCTLACSMLQQCYAFTVAAQKIDSKLYCQLVVGKLIRENLVEDPEYNLYLTGGYLHSTP